MRKNKYLARIITFTMMSTLVFSNVLTASAKEYETGVVKDYQEDVNINSILIKAGLSQENIDHLDQYARVDIAEAYTKDPNSVTVSTSIMEVDVLAEIDDYVNATYDEKIKSGMSDEQIEQMDEEIEHYNEMSDDEMKNTYNADEVELKLLREALKPDEDYKVKNKDLDVTASGSITTAEMNFGTYKINNSTSSNVNITVYSDAWWNDVYFYGMFNDKIAFAWGGGLTQYSVSANAAYYEVNSGDWVSGGYAGTQNVTYNEEAIDAGGYYSFPQANSSGAKAREINICFKLKQSGYLGRSTKILSQFCHQTLTGSPTISITASGPEVSLTPGTAYDVSYQDQDVIYY